MIARGIQLSPVTSTLTFARLLIESYPVLDK
jgi:hypothetical protein